VVLIDAEPVKALRFGVFELIEVGVVDLVSALRVVERARDVDAGRNL
jgi:hypothetical protein